MRKPAWTKKKTYGDYKRNNCSFCGKYATQKTETGLDVCRDHLKAKLEEIKCTCGSWLEQRNGKFGPYFNCLNCGNFNFNKGMEIKAITMKDQPTTKTITSKKPKTSSKPFQRTSYEKKNPKEITITSNDVEYFD